jgi:hypothetical protein
MDAAIIREKLETSDKWLFRAVVAIYERQTADEQAAEETRENNGIGFSGVDAAILSSFAKQIMEWNRGESTYRTPLSERQTTLARKKMKKYAGQLSRIAAARVTAPAAE